MRYYAVILMTALLVGAAPGDPAVAQAVSVIVDGRVVAFDQPPAVIAGRLLVPLRGVFERLGARVIWQPGYGRVVAQRADTQVVLQPGSRQAFVNGQSVILDSAPLVLGGRVLVPLRFISESLGAAVDWDPGARTVYVNSSAPAALPPAPVRRPQPVQPQPLPPFQPAPPPPAPAPAPEPIQPPSRPEPQPRTVLEGTVLRVEPYANPPRLQIRSSDGVVSTIVVRSQTAIFLTEATSGRSGAAALDQIRRGDVVQVRLDAQLQAVGIRATYRELTGRVDRMSGRQIILTDGQMFRLADDAMVSVDGRAVNRDDLQRGMEMVLRVHPQTGEVWEVRARPLAAQPTAPPAAAVRIDTAAFNATAPLGAGGVLVVKAQGTPGSEAFFDIAGLQSGLRMVEGPPGHFTGQYAVRPGETVNQGAVTVRFRTGGVEVSKSAGAITLDGLAPQFVRAQPANDAVLRVSQPTIAAWFNERGPSGIDLNSGRLWVNGTEIPRLDRTATYLSYTPPTPLPNGRIQVVARIGDRAGNIATTSWSFVVDVPATSAAPSPAPAAVAPAPRATPAAVAPAPRATPATAPSPRPVQVAAPVITVPTQGETVAAASVIRGTGPAGHRVEVTVELQFSGNVTKILGPFSANIASNGTWEVQVQFAPLDVQSARQATVSAVIIAPNGARSEPVKVLLRPATRDPGGPGG